MPSAITAISSPLAVDRPRYQHRGLRIAAETGRQRLVDLDPAERKLAQIADARKAGSEIVQRNTHPLRGERCDCTIGAVRIVDEISFRDLDLQSFGRKSGFTKNLALEVAEPH